MSKFLTPYKDREIARDPYTIIADNYDTVTYRNIVTGEVFSMPRRYSIKKKYVNSSRVLY